MSCYDDGCPNNITCVWWVNRDMTGTLGKTNFSLFPYDIPISDPCPNYKGMQVP